MTWKEIFENEIIGWEDYFQRLLWCYKGVWIENINHITFSEIIDSVDAETFEQYDDEVPDTMTKEDEQAFELYKLDIKACAEKWEKSCRCMADRYGCEIIDIDEFFNNFWGDKNE